MTSWMQLVEFALVETLDFLFSSSTSMLCSLDAKVKSKTSIPSCLGAGVA